MVSQKVYPKATIAGGVKRNFTIPNRINPNILPNSPNISNAKVGFMIGLNCLELKINLKSNLSLKSFYSL